MQTLRAVTEATAGVTGEEFFRSLVRHLAQALQMRYAFIAECVDDIKTQVRTLAFWNGAEFADNVGFPLSGTPCENVVGGKDCYHPERLQHLFPKDVGLVKLNAQSYIGVPVLNSNGEILGHVVVMDDKPRDELDQYLPLLHTFGARAGAELERKRVDDALRQSETRRRALLDINNAIVTKLASDELWSTIAHALGLVLPFDRIALALYDAEAGALRIVTHAGSYERTDYTPVGRMLDLRDSAANLRVRGWLWWRKVVLPGIFPYYLTGAITATGGSWNASIVAEFVSWGDQRLVARGIGSYIASATEVGDQPRVVLGIAVMSVLVILFNRALWRPLYRYAERRFRLA
jgi:hypothetical protein